MILTAVEYQGNNEPAGEEELPQREDEAADCVDAALGAHPRNRGSRVSDRESESGVEQRDSMSEFEACHFQWHKATAVHCVGVFRCIRRPWHELRPLCKGETRWQG